MSEINYRPLYYVQRYEAQTNFSNSDNISRHLSSDYMGSSEYEFGSVQAAVKFLRSSELVFQQTTLHGGGRIHDTVSFFSIGTYDGVKRFSKGIEKLLSKEGQYNTHERTYIYELYGQNKSAADYEEPSSYQRDIVAWFDIGSAYNFHPEDRDRHPVFFTADEILGRKIYLELIRKKVYTEASPKVLAIGDNVTTADEPSCAWSVCSPADDAGLVTIKHYKRRKRVNINDVWLTKDFPFEELMLDNPQRMDQSN